MIEQLSEYGEVEQKTKNSFYIRVHAQNRAEILKLIAKNLNGVYENKPISQSSIGYVSVKDKKIYVKPANREGDFSSGRQNELFLLNKLNSTQFEKIIFYTDTHTLIVEDVIEVLDCSKKTKQDQICKADLHIITKTDSFFISVKMTSAQYWESSDKYKHIAKFYLDKLLADNSIKLSEQNNVYKIEPNIAIECTTDEISKIVFGDDVSKNGCVLVQDFNEDHFKSENNILHVRCNQILQKPSDLKIHQKPYFLIRNDSTRNCVYKGLRILTCYKSRLNDKILTIFEKDRII